MAAYADAENHKRSVAARVGIVRSSVWAEMGRNASSGDLSSPTASADPALELAQGG